MACSIRILNAWSFFKTSLRYSSDWNSAKNSYFSFLMLLIAAISFILEIAFLVFSYSQTKFNRVCFLIRSALGAAALKLPACSSLVFLRSSIRWSKCLMSLANSLSGCRFDIIYWQCSCSKSNPCRKQGSCFMNSKTLFAALSRFCLWRPRPTFL